MYICESEVWLCVTFSRTHIKCHHMYASVYAFHRASDSLSARENQVNKFALMYSAAIYVHMLLL